MINYKTRYLFFFTVLFLIPLSFLAGVFSLKILLFAPIFAAVYCRWLLFQVPHFFSKLFEPEELSEDLNEALVISGKIALCVHVFNFQVKIFRHVEPHAFALRGFRNERIMYFSSGLIRSVSESELRSIFRELNQRLENPVSSWLALYTALLYRCLPKKPLTNETPWMVWMHLFRLSLAREVFRNFPRLDNNAAQGQSVRFGSSSQGDFQFLSPLFMGPKVSSEYGSLESVLIRE